MSRYFRLFARGHAAGLMVRQAAAIAIVCLLSVGTNGELAQPELVAADALAPVTEFSRFDVGRWRKEHPHDGGNGWFPGNLEKADDGSLIITDATRAWGHWLGPLGVRGRSHLANWQRYPAFAALTPDVLRSQDGSLALQAIEVVHVVPGSPADGHLLPGDLIINFMGQPIRDAAEYRPEHMFTHKERRDIQVQTGELIDQAEAIGSFHGSILRVPAENKRLWTSSVLAERKTESASVPVVEGGWVTLTFKDAGDGIGADHGAWIDGSFSGPGGRIGIDTLTPTDMHSGWGFVAKNLDFDNQPLTSPGWRCHANGHITFAVPPGMNHLDITAASLNKGRIVADITSRDPIPRLPVETSVLWKGVVGNQQTGPQSFDVPVTGEGRLHLKVGDGGDQIHGDGVLWADVVLSGTYGSQKLSTLKPIAVGNGYGRVQTLSAEPLEHKGVTYRDGWRCHAVADFVWPLPEGTQRIAGTFMPLSYGKVAPEITVEPLLTTPPASLRSWMHDIRFPIHKIGAFAEGYPYGCKKSDFLLEQTCDWLAAQQRDDGSWPCWAGYTTDSFHTAFCALALMSTGDRKYDDHVQRAANSVIWQMGPSGWTCPRAMVLIFLSELYLRDKDPRLLPAIQNAARQLVACVKTDLMAGHGVNGFGYGYEGQYIGTGFMQLGLALASLCPIEMDRTYLDDLLAHIAEISCNGAYPYGRGWRAIRDGNYHQTGGNAMHGPAALAARITGSRFSEHVVADAIQRWNAVAGDGDNSHATSTLAFIWSSLAMNACDTDTFQRHMEVFRYKMANDHSFDGGWLKSSFILDFQGGEGVTGLWIRSAGAALILAAPRRTLAITGNPALIAKTLQPGTPCREYDLFVRDFYARNLSLAKAVLGEAAPAGILKLRDDLLALRRDSTLNRAQARLLGKRVPNVVADIARLRGIGDEQRSHAIELVTGIDFRIVVDGGRFKVVACMPFQQLAWAASDETVKQLPKEHPLPFMAELSFADASLKDLACRFDSREEGWNWRDGTARLERQLPTDHLPTTAPLLIRFQVGDVMTAYTRTIRFRDPDAKGRVSDVTNFRRLTVRAPMAANPVYQTQPVMLDGVAFEGMMLNEAPNFARVKGVQPPGKQPVAIHEGDEVDFELVSAQPLCLEVISMDVQKRPDRVAPRSIRAISEGFTLKGERAILGDGATDREVVLEGPRDVDHAVIELAFDEPTRLNGLDFHWNGGQRLVSIWALIDGEWRGLTWDGYDAGAGFHPTFSTVVTDRMRIKMACRGHRITFQEISPYFNEHQRSLFRPLWEAAAVRPRLSDGP